MILRATIATWGLYIGENNVWLRSKTICNDTDRKYISVKKTPQKIQLRRENKIIRTKVHMPHLPISLLSYICKNPLLHYMTYLINICILSRPCALSWTMRYISNYANLQWGNINWCVWFILSAEIIYIFLSF